jgi:hypothetical protein
LALTQSDTYFLNHSAKDGGRLTGGCAKDFLDLGYKLAILKSAIH